MKAMIFAAGLGTRLKPLTDTMPKALVPVAGKPLLWHTIQKLKAAGFDEIIINVHHFAEQIIDYVRANDNFGIRIEFSDESQQLLDTGGGIKKASWFFDDEKPFLIHNVDILSDIDLQSFYRFHSSGDTTATLVVSERETARYLLFDKNHHLTGWINEKSGEIKSPFPDFNSDRYKKLAFSGIQSLHPSIFDYMQDFPEKFSIIDFYLSVCKIERITAFIPQNLQLIDVGKIDSLTEAEKFY
ncbi:MAG TPA: mannose-1-phosphate guanyltransferase [Porphyromonadaceae bacterium]|jgi:NDP-sugar pyrophosphorylase family protein|nr:mannose-1-phosphate guanyltransferase [Porphyromonadaceae bacterium]HBK94126.1 mannose-1-phosphate guanyltransferase [Porphyromonadaceae bacterium]HBU45415.1 mannose-1-phosphate guanyltransferase [Porphyromonadaceae bacterium]HBX45681.1 mannose-1-phosphate guanyltransferase [Porphyromonadaceae bacterium]